MQYRRLGSTGIQVSAISFGAGPIPALLTGDDRARQLAVVQHAIDRGINWFDTAAGYGDGASESNLGAVLEQLGAQHAVHVATKVRLLDSDHGQLADAVVASVRRSLDRLRLPRVALLQLHNALTVRRGDEPTSLTPSDVLGPSGVLEGLERVRDLGWADWIGLTGIGQPVAQREVIASGRFQTLQVPYNLLNPSAGSEVPSDFAEANYGGVMNDCRALNMGVFAIRVFAGGALAGLPPSDYTYRTRFFPLDLYHRDQARAAALAAELTGDTAGSTEAGDVDASDSARVLRRAALRFSLAHPSVSSAILGLNAIEQVDEACAAVE
ncbi:MAG: aldo/keto reductase [Byssovorax sp.]